MSETPQKSRLTRRRPTIRDVAEHAGVSKSLVSLVLRDSPKVSDRSRAMVQDSIRELGYRPSAMARSLVSGKSGLIGVVTTNLLDFFYFEVIEGMSKHIEADGAQLYPLLIRTDRDAGAEERAVENFLQLQVEGLILMGTTLPDETIEDLAGEVPTSVVGHHVDSATVDVIAIDDVRGGNLATQHLIDLGHREIVHVRGNGSGAAERERGFRDAIARADVSGTVLEGGYNVEDGAAAMRSLLNAGGELPTAVFAANDLSALGVLNAIRDAGQSVPDDYSVIGFDDIALAAWRGIELSTVNQPTSEMGELAARLLIKRIESPGVPAQRVRIEPTLVLRSTTGAV